jgi:glutathione peroxidase-family protein
MIEITKYTYLEMASKKKFLMDKQGKVVERFAKSVTPEQLDDRISQLL